MTKEQVAHVTKRFNEATDGSPNVNILWVDDTPINNRTVIGIFEAMGFHVYVARSYAEGIARFDERPFNVVISDYNEERDPDQIEAKKTGRADWGVGALIAEHVGKSCGARTIIFSAGWDPGQSTPPYAVVETNNRYVLLDATANLIEKPIEPDCL
ncbi:hypothetical protein MESS2_1030160 [Mesorhizobium metallidurans STM 2683]|uniref:Response regulatory domain-containing protein n=2 Tax=Mesorhizobium metallidurans TaxID=489722 RepID=M5EGN8_9HYPH|nr:hypothetical protein MESS2_1030160 [Mesorhizobium metallidurans STM 2683]